MRSEAPCSLAVRLHEGKAQRCDERSKLVASSFQSTFCQNPETSGGKDRVGGGWQSSPRSKVQALLGSCWLLGLLEGWVCPEAESKELQEWRLGVSGARAGPGRGNDGEDPSVLSIPR